METRIRQEIKEIYRCLPQSETSLGYRIVFPVKYPSGRWVSVWLVERTGRFLLTDHGETVWDLEMFGYDVLANRHYAVDEILERHSSWRKGAVMYSEYRGPHSIEAFVTALVSVASLIYTRRGKAMVEFKVEVGNFLQKEFTKTYEIVRQYRFRTRGKTYIVHFALKTKDNGKVPSALIHTVSATQISTLKAKRDDLLKIWWAAYQNNELGVVRRISLIDDRPWRQKGNGGWRELLDAVHEIRDYLRIEKLGVELTKIFLWSEHEKLIQVLKTKEG